MADTTTAEEDSTGSEVESEVEVTPSVSKDDEEEEQSGTDEPRKSAELPGQPGGLVNVTASEKKYLDSHFAVGNDEILYAKHMRVGTKKGSVDKLVAVGNHRVVLLKKGAFGKSKAEKDGHLFNLREVKSHESNKLHLKFNDFTLDLSGDGAGEEMLDIIRTAVLKITGCFPAESVPSFDTKSDPPHVEFGEDKGFLATYKAWCSFYHLPCSQNFVHYVESLLGENSTELLLHECSGIETKTSHTFDLQPVAATLRYSTYFTTVSLKSIPRKEAVSLFASALSTNTTITKLVLSGLEAEQEGFVQLGEALKKNPDNSLKEIDLSHNHMKDPGMVALAAGLAEMKHGLKKFSVSHCGIQAKGIAALMKAFDANHPLSLSIEELDISFNAVHQPGTTALSNWLSNMRQGEENMSSLVNVNLAGCQVDLFGLMQGLKSSIKDKLEVLDISHNKITKQSVDAVAEFLEDCEALSQIKLHNCALTPEVLESILEALNKNSLSAAVTVDFSENELGVHGAKSVSKVVRYSKNIHTLVLRGTGLKKEGLKEILKAVEQNTSIKGLDISDNVKGKNPDVVKGLKDILDNSGIEELWIAQNGLGKELDLFLKGLTNNSKLQLLDITGNNIGDGVAISLAEAMSKNTTLKTLKWDENQVNLSGWQTFCSALKNNKTLQTVPPPEKDMMKAVASAKDKTKHREKVTEVINQIAQITKENADQAQQ